MNENNTPDRIYEPGTFYIIRKEAFPLDEIKEEIEYLRKVRDGRWPPGNSESLLVKILSILE